MEQPNKYNSTEKFIREHLIQIQHRFDVCTTELTTQSLSCPKTLSLINIESSLKEFVRLHHFDLTRKVNYHINQFKDCIREKELYERLSSYTLTKDQVC
jgi:hypothetical protein